MRFKGVSGALYGGLRDLKRLGNASLLKLLEMRSIVVVGSLSS